MSRSMVVFLLVFAPAFALILVWLGSQSMHTNLLGWFLILMGVAYLIGGPIYVWKRKGEAPARKEEAGDRSFWLVQPGFFFAIFGAPIEYLYLPETLPRACFMEIVGLALITVSVGLISWARQALRGQFSGHIQIQPEHKLIKNGPYKHIRNPGYLGYILLALGISIGFGSLVAFAALVLLLLPGVVYRILVEEKLLAQGFGKEYQDYLHKTSRLLPGIW